MTTAPDDPRPPADSVAPGALNELALLMNAGRYVELEGKARRLLAQHPNSGLVWQLLAVAVRMQGQDALPALEKAAVLLPHDAGAHNNLGNALAQRGRLNDALASFRQALALNPEFAEAHNNLGNVWRGLGQLDDALAGYRRALHIKPNYAEAHHNLGDALLRLGKLDDAVASYRRAVALSPDFAEALNNLGNALQELGRPEDAMASYRRALAVSPNFAEAHTNLGNVLRGLGQLDDALACYRRALEARPDFAETHSNLAIALRLQGHSVEAQASCRRALEINPGLAAAIAVLAEMSADQGLFGQAEQLFRRALALDAETAEAWVGVSRLRKMTAGDAAWAAEAQRIAGRSLPPRKEVLLRYAIGKYFDDVGDFEQAFANYRRANALTKLYRPRYDPQQLSQAIDLIIGSYDSQWMRQTRIDSNPSARPVFVVGMIRSGTTLAEQILASHPAVFGAGELMFWSGAAAQFHPAPAGGAKQVRALSDLADAYLRLLNGLSGDALRVIDKMPGNFLHLGLIHAALPHARIIHMRRHPIDTCLSIYFQHFETFHAYATDLSDLAHYYRQYQRLMRHWRSSLPADTLLDVPYEGLIGDQEAWSRGMMEFIGLPWDARCMEFHRTERTVITASKWQVRQKISASSVNRWRNYEKFVAPLRGLAQEP